MKVIINKCYGGFGISDKAYERLIELGCPVVAWENYPIIKDENGNDICDDKGKHIIIDRELTPEGTDVVNDIYYKYKDSGTKERYWDCWTSEHRSDPLLVQVVEELVEDANGKYAKLKVVEVPDDVSWYISNYDGHECIHEEHRQWY